eukprot:5119023-Amphidinium_carterae.1
MDDDEYNQTIRFCNETDEFMVHMIKMNIKLPNPTAFDGKTPQFNEWAEEVESYLTVHNIFIDDLMDDSC